jgi:translation initiation factor 3 subunit B
LDCESPEEAEKILKALDNYKLDKAHVFAVNRFADFERFLSAQETYVAPKKDEYKEKV